MSLANGCPVCHKPLIKQEGTSRRCPHPHFNNCLGLYFGEGPNKKVAFIYVYLSEKEKGSDFIFANFTTDTMFVQLNQHGKHVPLLSLDLNKIPKDYQNFFKNYIIFS